MAYNLGYSGSAYDLDKQKENVQPSPQGGADVPERGTWSKSVQSLLLCISMSVGLGNVWRFPNVAYNNGGGAFLIPYLLLLVIIGRPLYYLELILGQFSSQGPIKVWRCVPAFRGIGYAQMVSLAFILIFYNYLMSLSVWYIFASMRECLPWTECAFPNGTFSQNGSSTDGLAPSEYYWIHHVLEEGTEGEITISWKLVVCLLVTWIVVYVCVVQGTNSLGKMSYFTAIFPYFVLVALLVIACCEEGAWEGIKYFFQPDLEKLKDINVWYKATEQSFFSLTIGYGNIVMIASYNKFRNNVYRDAIIISVLDTLTNIMAGCVIFAVLGTLSFKYSKNIDEVVNHEGLGLAFVVYPEALATIRYVPQLWAVLFFFMLLILGIGSSMSMMETMLTVLKDQFPRLRQRKWLLAGAACALFFLLGLPLTTSKGQQVLVLLNNYGAGVAVFFYATLEVVGVTWIYGLNNFCRDVQFMSKQAPGIFWKVTWAFTAPVALSVIFVFGMVQAQSADDPGAPAWTTAAGWFLAAFALVQIPLWWIVAVYRDPHPTLRQKFMGAFGPSDRWGPGDPVHRAAWRATKRPPSGPPPAYCNESFKEDVF